MREANDPISHQATNRELDRSAIQAPTHQTPRATPPITAHMGEDQLESFAIALETRAMQSSSEKALEAAQSERPSSMLTLATVSP